MSNFLFINENKHSLHTIYNLDRNSINSILQRIKIPVELQEFYEQVGYGFFYSKNDSGIFRILDPKSFMQINLRQDYFQYDPDLELYSDIYEDRSIFFEVNEGVYLGLNNKDIDGKNEVFLLDKKISNSLEDFIIKINDNCDFLIE